MLDWNINAVNAIGNGPTAAIPGLGQPPPLAVIHLAMVHGAVYDAVNAIDGGHKPYLSGLASAPGASRAAAVATAAHDVLLALPPLPPNSPDAMRANVAELYRLYMLQIPEGTAKTQGIAIGQAARYGHERWRAPMTAASWVRRSGRSARSRANGARWQPPQRERVRLGRQRQAVHAQEHRSVPHGGAV